MPPRPSILERREVDAATWKQAEIMDADTLFRLVASERPDLIVHLAGFASGALARRAPGEAFSLNAAGTLNLCAAVGLVKPSGLAIHNFEFCHDAHLSQVFFAFPCGLCC